MRCLLWNKISFRKLSTEESVNIQKNTSTKPFLLTCMKFKKVSYWNTDQSLHLAVCCLCVKVVVKGLWISLSVVWFNSFIFILFDHIFLHIALKTHNINQELSFFKISCSLRKPDHDQREKKTFFEGSAQDCSNFFMKMKKLEQYCAEPWTCCTTKTFVLIKEPAACMVSVDLDRNACRWIWIHTDLKSLLQLSTCMFFLTIVRIGNW